MGNTLRKITALAAAAALAALGLATVAAPAAAQSGGCGGARDVSAGHYARSGIRRLSTAGVLTSGDCLEVIHRPASAPVVVNEFKGSDAITVGTLKRWMERYDERTDRPTNLHVADAYLSGHKDSEPITRDTAAVVFAGFYGLKPKYGDAPFSGDTKSTTATHPGTAMTEWSASVSALKDAGITVGTTADTYSPHSPFTRNHAAAFFDRWADGFTDPPAAPQPEQVSASFVGHTPGPYLIGASTPSTYTGHGARQVLQRLGVTGGTILLPARSSGCDHTYTSKVRTAPTGRNMFETSTACHQVHTVPTCGESDRSYGHPGERSTVKACPKPRLASDPALRVTKSPAGIDFKIVIEDPDAIDNRQVYLAWTEECTGDGCARAGIDFAKEFEPAKLEAQVTKRHNRPPKVEMPAMIIKTFNRGGSYCGSGQTTAADGCVEAFGTEGRTLVLVMVNEAAPDKDDPAHQVRTPLTIEPPMQGSQ